MRVQIEHDAVPIVKIVGAMAQRSLRDPGIVKHVARARGLAVLSSATDPQAVTVTFDGSTVSVRRGVDPAADVTIEADLNDSSAKPKLSGAARHPLLALAMGKLLEPPIGDWRAEAEVFLSAATRHERCPRPVRVVPVDGGQPQQWGGEGDPAIEIHGPCSQLASAFSASSVMAQDILESRLWIIGDLRDLSALTEFSILHMFGELA